MSDSESDFEEFEVRSCSSDDESEDLQECQSEGEENQPIFKRIKFGTPQWEFLSQFPSKKDGKKFILEEDKWIYQSKNKVLDGIKSYYYCKKRDTQGCESILSMKGYEEKAAVDMLYIQL